MTENYDDVVREMFRPRLEDDLKETVAQIAGQAANVAPVELDQQSVGRLSRMDALQRQAMAQAVERRMKTQNLRIKQALDRMKRGGEFGYCSTCGDKIGIPRLEVDPAAHQCIKCANDESLRR